MKFGSTVSIIFKKNQKTWLFCKIGGSSPATDPTWIWSLHRASVKQPTASRRQMLCALHSCQGLLFFAPRTVPLNVPNLQFPSPLPALSESIKSQAWGSPGIHSLQAGLWGLPSMYSAIPSGGPSRIDFLPNDGSLTDSLLCPQGLSHSKNSIDGFCCRHIFKCQESI